MENSVTIFLFKVKIHIRFHVLFQIQADSDGQSDGVIQPQPDSNSKLKLLADVGEHS